MSIGKHSEVPQSDTSRDKRLSEMSVRMKGNQRRAEEVRISHHLSSLSLSACAICTLTGVLE